MRSIEINTTPSCPDCRFLKGWLNAMALKYVEYDLTRSDIAEEAKRRTGVRIAPITIFDNTVIVGPVAEHIKRIKSLLGIKRAA